MPWTEEGHKYAWRMKLRDKVGAARFQAVDSRGRAWEVDPLDYVTQFQFGAVATQPDMILQLAHHMAARLAEEHGPIEIRVDTLISLNGRRVCPLVDAQADLVRQPRSWGHSPWITELREPLPSPDEMSAVHRDNAKAVLEFLDGSVQMKYLKPQPR